VPRPAAVTTTFPTKYNHTHKNSFQNKFKLFQIFENIIYIYTSSSPISDFSGFLVQDILIN
jgi:hypothetical protein